MINFNSLSEHYVPDDYRVIIWYIWFSLLSLLKLFSNNFHQFSHGKLMKSLSDEVTALETPDRPTDTFELIGDTPEGLF